MNFTVVKAKKEILEMCRGVQYTAVLDADVLAF